MTLDQSISLKYWLDDPFWTRMSSPERLLPEVSAAGAGPGSSSGGLVATSDTGGLGVDRCDSDPSVAWARDRSRLEMRPAISAIMVLLGRRATRPTGGNTHGLPARTQCAHGSLLSQRTLRWLQSWHDRGTRRAVRVGPADSDSASGDGETGPMMLHWARSSGPEMICNPSFSFYLLAACCRRR